MRVLRIVAAALVCGRGAWAVGTTNRVPQTESFESYADGVAIAQAPGWSIAAAPPIGVGRVTTNAEAIAALTAYTGNGGILPLDTTHAKVLALGGPVTQNVAGPAGRLVRSEFMLMPALRAEFSAPDPTLQVGLCFDTNGQAVVFHHDALAGSNLWRVLTAASPVSSQEWVRVTLLQDYANHLFQVRLNNGSPISDSAGWSGPSPGGTQPGAWFYMPNTNAAMSQIRFTGEGRAFLDDLTVLGDLPAIATRPASNVTELSAELVGELTSAGLAPTAVTLYWGPTDGNTNASAWANTNRWAAPQPAGRVVWSTAAALPDALFYRYAASNAYGLVWSDHSELIITGSVAVTAIDNDAGERPLNSGKFRITRPAAMTDGALTVVYAISGTASNGSDYERLAGTVTIPNGAAQTDVLVTPVCDSETEDSETITLILEPAGYLVGVPASATVNLADAQSEDLLWNNGSGDHSWNVTSANWYGNKLFYPGDRVTFDVLGGGRVYVGTDTAWDEGGQRWIDAVAQNVVIGQLTVTTNQFEFDGGEILGGPATIQGGRVIDRRLGRSTFGTGTLTLSGDGEFWRQIPPDASANLQILDNPLRVAGTATLQGGRGINIWQGDVELEARLNIGGLAAAQEQVNRFTGRLTLNQDTNRVAARLVSLRAGGGEVFLDGPIVDDPNPGHHGTFPLVLETAAEMGSLTLRGSNTYTCATVVTNASGTNTVTVAPGSSLGRGPVVVAGHGAQLLVQSSLAIGESLTVSGGGTVTLATNGAVSGSRTPIDVRDDARLILQSGDGLPDESVLTLDASALLDIASNLEERVGDLYLGGVRQPGGLYNHENLPANIVGGGGLRVRGDVPSGFIFWVR